MPRGSSPIDMVGQRFGRFVVLRRDGFQGHMAAWLCRCDCGEERTVGGSPLRQGKSLSCGCLNRERVSEANGTHRMSSTPTWRSWRSMHLRCENPKATGYDRYGGRGVTVCERWRSFEAFLEDMGERPVGTSIDRFPNRDGNYDPGNCRWATALEQASNKDNLRLITHEGRTQSLSAWSRELGVARHVLKRRFAQDAEMSKTHKS